MAHMIPVAEHFAAYHVETSAGVEVVLEEVGKLDLEDEDACRDSLFDYLEGTIVESAEDAIERKEGWYAHLSAPGYMDQTEWQGPYATADEALDAVKEQFDVDDNGDPDEHMPEDADDPLTIR